jgi:uncharacterized membrane protein YjfL (UPF0719 family)
MYMSNVLSRWRNVSKLPDFEVFAAVVSLVVAAQAWGNWYRSIASLSSFRESITAKLTLVLIPPACLLFFAVVVEKLGAPEVRQDPLYAGFYALIAAAWLGGNVLLFPLLGISPRDDVIERANVAALYPVSGALIGAACCFAGANIGNGPGIEAVLFSALLSTSLFFVCWLAVELTTRISDTITIDRDRAAAVRLSGFLVALGLLCGWAVAGDWVSAFATVRDFAGSSWPVLVLTIAAVAVERFLHRAKVPQGSSAIISIIYISAAVVWIIAHGLA